jgi:hypothetical protein
MIIDLPCFKMSVYPSDGKPWNGWVRYWRRAPIFKDDPAFLEVVDRWIPGVGQYYLAREAEEFQSGIYWVALEHLTQCYSCFKYNYEYRGTTLMKIEKKLHEIKREWKRVSE